MLPWRGPMEEPLFQRKRTRQGSDALVPTSRCFHTEAVGFWHSLKCLSWQNDNANQKEGTLPRSWCHVFPFILRTSGLQKGSNPSAWCKLNADPLLPAMKRRRENFIINQLQSSSATWRLRWADTEGWIRSGWRTGLLPKSSPLTSLFTVDGTRLACTLAGVPSATSCLPRH